MGKRTDGERCLGRAGSAYFSSKIPFASAHLKARHAKKPYQMKMSPNAAVAWPLSTHATIKAVAVESPINSRSALREGEPFRIFFTDAGAVSGTTYFREDMFFCRQR